MTLVRSGCWLSLKNFGKKYRRITENDVDIEKHHNFFVLKKELASRTCFKKLLSQKLIDWDNNKRNLLIRKTEDEYDVYEAELKEKKENNRALVLAGRSEELEDDADDGYETDFDDDDEDDETFEESDETLDETDIIDEFSNQHLHGDHNFLSVSEVQRIRNI